jgi:hypothetical protein
MNLKVSTGRALRLGLEFLIAADLISTVTVEPTREKIVSLALLIVVRTFLSWSIAVEIEGCWPMAGCEQKKGLKLWRSGTELSQVFSPGWMARFISDLLCSHQWQ